MTLGVHFALTQAEVDRLWAFREDEERLSYLQDVIEPTYLQNYPELSAQSDKSWDAMHRALADGELTWDGGSYPLNHAVLAGELLYAEDDYIMSLKTPEQVRDIAAALSAMTEPEFRRRYFTIDPDDYDGELAEEDFAYTWDGFCDVRDLYLRAAQERWFVLFTADQ